MKCLKCGMEVNENSSICPFCGSSVPKSEKKHIETEDFELPVLKTANKTPDVNEADNDMLNSLAEKFAEENVSLEKTRTIKPIEDQNEFSLLEDINKQINSVNEEAEAKTPQIVESPKDETHIPVQEEVTKEKPVAPNPEEPAKEELPPTSLETKESVNKRTKVLVVTGLIALVVVGLLFFCVSTLLKANKPTTTEIEENLNKALETYYTSGKTEDISNILEEVKDDEDVLAEVQNKVKAKSNEWLQEYYDTEYVSQAEFNTATTRYKDLFRGLYEYAIVREDDYYVRALESSNYESLINDIDDNYNDSRIFYEAIDLYNNRDYNKSYYALNQIPSNSIIYNKTRIYVDRINSNVIGLLKNDIAKIEQDPANLDDSELLDMYTQIEQIIIDYDHVYNNLELTKNKDYSDLLSDYSNKVNQYSK